MMWWNGSWMWMWLAAVPMVLLTWALIAAVVLPPLRVQRERLASPREHLDRRLAAGEITVDEHRLRRSELEHRS